MPEASASPSAIATLIVLSPANDAMVIIRTIVDHRWPEVAECFVVFRESLERRREYRYNITLYLVTHVM